MNRLVVYFKVLLLVISANHVATSKCTCFRTEEYVTCTTKEPRPRFNANVAFANMNAAQKLMSNTIPFDKITSLRIQCLIKSIQLDSFKNQHPMKNLDLSQNFIETFPNQMFQSLPFLETLNISRNELKNPTLDTFAALSNLTVLDASHNSFMVINLGVLDDMEKLQELYVNDNKISFLPGGVFDLLVNLRKLDLSNNKLTVVEYNIFEYTTSLQEVNLSGNDLSGVEALVGLDSLNLVIDLDLSNCNIEQLPPSVFSRLTKLQRLNLNFNVIKTLTTVFNGAEHLLTLHMAHNRLHSIPGHLFDNNLKLEEVDWSYNQLKTLPNELFRKTEYFKYMNLSHNMITDLPIKIFQWTGLAEIDLSHNQFTTLEPELLNMETLERVHAQHNKIAFLEDAAFSSCTFPVRYIDLKYNRLVYLQEYFFDWLANLERLEIFGNPFDCTCFHDLIKLLTNRFIKYDAENYNTSKAICAVGENSVCQYYNTNLTYFYEMFKHIV